MVKQKGGKRKGAKQDAVQRNTIEQYLVRGRKRSHDESLSQHSFYEAADSQSQRRRSSMLDNSQLLVEMRESSSEIIDISQCSLDSTQRSAMNESQQATSTSYDGPFSFDNIRDILFRQIAHFLPVFDLFTLSLTCKHMNSLCREVLRDRRKAAQRGKLRTGFEQLQSLSTGRYGHAIAYHEPEHRVYVCGGQSENAATLNDMSYFDLRTGKWGKDVYKGIMSLQPSKCMYASLCSYKNSLILFGGYYYDATPVSSLPRVFALDLVQKRWSLAFCPLNIRNVHGHTALVFKEKFMVTFGGHTGTGPANLGGNEMYMMDCNNITAIFAVKQTNDRPLPRVFPSLAFVGDRHLVVVGGRTSIKEPYESLKDAFLFEFTNENFTEGFWTRVEIDGVDLWPKCMPSFAPAFDYIYMVSMPADPTHIQIGNNLLHRLYNARVAAKEFASFGDNERRPLCSEALLPNRRRPQNSMDFGMSSGHYLRDFRLFDTSTITQTSSENQENICADLNETQLSEAQKLLAVDCNVMIRELYELQSVNLYPDDIQANLLWHNNGRHLDACAKKGQYRLCVGACFREGGCAYEALKKFYSSASEEFLKQLCATLYHIAGYACHDFLGLDYPPLPECDYWKGVEDERKGIVPLTDFLQLQSLVPVHRAVFDVPISCAVYKLDLRGVVETGKIRLTQEPVRFMAPLFNKYAAMAFTGDGFLLCGGLSGAWKHLVAGFPDKPPIRPSKDTIFIG